MLTFGFILLLCTDCLVKTQADQFHRDNNIVFVQERDNVTITCLYQSDMAMHFSWYRHKVGQKPELISSTYKYETNIILYREFKNNGRFDMVTSKGMIILKIKDVQLSDSATYYCGSAHSNIVEFGQGTELIIKASQSQSISLLQRPVLDPVHPGDNVTLQCTVVAESCAGEHSVFWIRHGSGESHPGIIYTHGDSSDQCKNRSDAGSSTQSCIYSLPKRNLSTSDAGTYYCAVATCGVIHFGNGTTLNLNNKGVECSEHVHILVLLSVFRASILLCVFALTILYYYRCKKTNVMKTDLHLRSVQKKTMSYNS